MLLKRSNGSVDGFIVEGPTAGGHNAPPRNRRELTESGEPAYGEADEPDLEKLRSLGRPFWLAGSWSSPDSLARARAAGAAGVQTGSIFALSSDSGVEDALREAAIEIGRANDLRVFTNPRSSTSGFPFKECSIPGTLSDERVYDGRERICDIGALRQLYRTPSGKVGYRCSGEPVADYSKKGGSVEDTVGRRCLCNALMATIGMGQRRPKLDYTEPALLTLGSDYSFLPHLTRNGPKYSAKDAIAYLLGESDSDGEIGMESPCG
jgi:NAD(P)H-dependent flavin oxidoreductase YrpB (nitropropane dioxygenase family)